MSEASKNVTASLIIIGNEILSGRTEDKNAPFLAKQLNEIGIGLREIRVVPDIEDEIVDALNACRARYDYVFTTGGIGPTHDDITSDSVAKAIGVKNVIHDEARAILGEHYGDQDLNEARMRMAHTPEGAVLVENPISKAPGYQIENVFVLAGVPIIMQAMFDSLRHRLVGGPPIRSHTIRAELPEGKVAKGLGRIQVTYPDVEIGSYPFFRMGIVGCSLVLRGTDEALLAAAVDAVRGLIRDLGAEPVDETEA